MSDANAPTRFVRPEVVTAAARVPHLGFLLVSPIPPGAEQSQLTVALRRTPTRAHFDPETVRYWATGSDRRGHAQELTAGSRMPRVGTFTWGKIEVVDRFGVENDFVTLGGQLFADRLDEDLAVAVFRSPAPILRMGGHSQAEDRMALELAAFFGRAMVPIDFDPGVEQAIAAADPLTRYSGFVAFESERYRAHQVLRLEHPALAELLAEEAQRLRATHPDAWERGTALLGSLHLTG